MNGGTTMKIAELMTTDLQTITADATVAEAVVALADWHVHGLPVLDERTGGLIGVLSTTDVLEAAAECTDTDESNLMFREKSVGDLMTRRPATSAPDDDVRTAAQQMLYLDVHRLFVENDGKLVGVISQSDIVGAMATAKI
jgi:CBS domain-containing protein